MWKVQFSEQDVSKIQDVLREGPIFGLELIQSASPNPWVCLNYEEFSKIIDSQSEFTYGYIIWSVKKLFLDGLYVTHNLVEKTDSILDPLPNCQLELVKNFLNISYSEVICIFISWNNFGAECKIYDLDILDEFIDSLKNYSRQNCEVYVFPYGQIDDSQNYLAVAMPK